MVYIVWSLIVYAYVVGANSLLLNLSLGRAIGQSTSYVHQLFNLFVGNAFVVSTDQICVVWMSFHGWWYDILDEWGQVFGFPLQQFGLGKDRLFYGWCMITRE